MLKPGDLVQIKPSFGMYDDPGGCTFTPSMQPFLGRWVTIVQTIDDFFNERSLYELAEDDGKHRFSENMFTSESMDAELRSHPLVSSLLLQLAELQKENLFLKQTHVPTSQGVQRKVVKI